MRRGERGERAAAVDRLHDRRVHDVHDVRDLRIGDDVRVVPRTGANCAIVARAAPRLARVVRAIESAGVGFDVRVDAIWISRRDADADLADDAGGKTAGELRPRVATIGGLPDAARGPAASDLPWKTTEVPERCVEN